MLNHQHLYIREAHQLENKIMSTHEIEALFLANLFKRIHRSFIVSLNKIESYTAEMVEVNGVTIPIGRDYRGVIENL